MMDTRELHQEAMELAEQADAARRTGNIKSAFQLYAAAFNLERQAAETVTHEPARSILLRSAATLALDCGNLVEAEKLAAQGLLGTPTTDIAEQLRDVIERANFQRHLGLRGELLAAEQLQITLTGNAVSKGVILSEVFVQKLKDFEVLVFRTAERKRKVPFRESGRPRKSTQKEFSIYLSTARAGSYSVTIQLGTPVEQMDQPLLPGITDVSEIIDELLECLNLINTESYEALRQRINDPVYFRNFVAVSKRFAPDGNQVKLIGITRVRDDQESSISFTRNQSDITPIQEPIEELAADSIPAGTPTVLEGKLKYADDVSHREIKIVLNDGKTKTIVVPEGIMDDIVRPLWNTTVRVRGLKVGRKIQLTDIESISE